MGEDLTNMLLDPVMSQQGGRALMQMMQMERAARMSMQGGGMASQAPRAAAPRVSGRSGRVAGGGTGYPSSASDFSGSPQLGDLLAQYGLHPAQAQPNVLLPNSGFFGDHPNLSRGLENAVIAAAHTPESTTAGGAISAVAQGLLSIPQYRNQIQGQRQMAPLAMAGAMQFLQKGQLDNDLSRAHAGYYQAETAALPTKAAYNQATLEARQEFQNQVLDLRRQNQNEVERHNAALEEVNQRVKEGNERYKDSQSQLGQARLFQNPHIGALAESGWDPNSGTNPTGEQLSKASRLEHSRAMSLAAQRGDLTTKRQNDKLRTTTDVGMIKDTIRAKQKELQLADSDPKSRMRWYLTNRAAMQGTKGLNDPEVEKRWQAYKTGLQSQIDALHGQALSAIPD